MKKMAAIECHLMRGLPQVLLQIPGVKGAAVVGLPHPRLGEQVTAVIQTTTEGTTLPLMHGIALPHSSDCRSHRWQH